MNRRAFVHALVGLPVAAALLPKTVAPTPVATVTPVPAHHYIARYLQRDAKTRAGRVLSVTITADTSQFAAAIDETHRLDRQLHDRLMQRIR